MCGQAAGYFEVKTFIFIMPSYIKLKLLFKFSRVMLNLESLDLHENSLLFKA
jgi:hypothetical protein